MTEFIHHSRHDDENIDLEWITHGNTENWKRYSKKKNYFGNNIESLRFIVKCEINQNVVIIPNEYSKKKNIKLNMKENSSYAFCAF